MMQSVEQFLAYAITIEQEAALRFDQLADAMSACGNREVAQLFKRLALASHGHLKDVRARSAWRDLPEMGSDDFVWPDLESPETAAIWAADPMIGRDQALEIALAAENAGLNYYRAVLETTADPEIRDMARDFVDEETAHVLALENSRRMQFAMAAS
jgi:rubrerythrin